MARGGGNDPERTTRFTALIANCFLREGMRRVRTIHIAEGAPMALRSLFGGFAPLLAIFSFGMIYVLSLNVPVMAQDLKRSANCEPDNPAYKVAERAVEADAEREASAAIAAGNFQLRCPVDSHNGMMWYGCGIQCKLDLYDLDKGAANPVWGDVTASRWDICVSKFRQASERYAGIYNRKLLAAASFPHKDICRDPAKSTADDYYEYKESIDVRPNNDGAPVVVEKIATAARFGRLDDVKRLLSARAEPHEPDLFGISGLEWAAARGYTEIVEVLVQQTGAKQAYKFESYRGHHELDPFRAAARYGHLDVFRKLIDAKFAPSMVFFEEDMFEQIGRGGHIDVLRYVTQELKLVEKLKSKEKGFKAVENAAHEASGRGHATVLEALLDLGVSPHLLSWNFMDGKINHSLLQTAIQKSRVETVKLLLRKGAQTTPDTLVYGTQWGNKDVIATLIDHGLDPNAKGHGAETYVAASQGTLPLIAASANCWPGYHKVLALTERGANPNLTDESGMTALHYSIKLSDRRGKKFSTGMSKKVTPDMLDGVPGNLECIDELIKAGADVNARDPNGAAPLHFAAYSDYHVPTITMLLQAGADINARDNSGQTPLDVAIAGELEQVPKLLLERGGKQRSDANPP
jgi:ankyrin repeat protein